MQSQADDRAAAGRFEGNERFEIIEALGAGAGGEVYEAYDRENQARVAIKSLLDLSAERVLLLKHEFRSLQDVTHSNLVRLGELFEERGQWFFTMELVKGVPLSAYVRPDGHDYDEGRLRSAIAQLVRALVAMHTAHKLHRDVKPANVLVESSGRLVLLDFGVVTDLRRSSGDVMVGTIAYMAPEQLLGEPVGRPADLYAVGVILYQCLTGRPPFEGSGDELVEAKLLGTASAPSEHVRGIPAELEQLCLALLASDPAERPSAAQTLAVLEQQAEARAPSLPPRDELFVGRERELAALQGAYDSGECATLLLRGESGVGKSHLVAHFADLLIKRQPNVLLLQGRCYERESVPYKGLDSIIDGVAELLAGLSPAQRQQLTPPNAHLLALAFPVLAAVLQVEQQVAEQLVPQEQRARVFGAVRDLLSELARTRRVVVVIDDIQWSNADGLALLRALLQAPHAPPLLWVLMARTESNVGQRLQLPGSVTTLDIERLDRAEANDLALQIVAQHSDLPTQAIEQAVREADGHPLFLSELLRHRNINQAGELRLDDVLWSRVSALPDAEREVTEALAIAGAPIPRAVLVAATGVTPDELFHCINRLQVDKLARTIGSDVKDSVAVFHDRVRESVCSKLGREVTTRWHIRLASAMERVGGVGDESLGYHWEHAGDRERAAHHIERAAEQAWLSLAFERAALALSKLLELRAPEGEQRSVLEVRLAQAWSNAGHGARAAQVRLAFAERVGGEVGIEQRLLAGGDLLMGGHHDEGRDVLRKVFKDLDLPYPGSRRRALFGLVARRLQIRMRGTGTTLRTPEQLDVRKRLRTDACWSGMNGLNLLDTVYGNYFGALHTLHALSLGDPRRVTFALVMEGLSAGAPNPAYTKRMLEDARKVADSIGSVETAAMIACGEGGTAYFWGEWERGVPALERCETLLRDRCVGMTYLLNTARFMLYRSLGMRGDVEMMRERMPRALREARERSDRYMLVNIRTTEVMVDCANDSFESAQSHIAEAASGLPTEGFHVQHYLCAFAKAQMLANWDRPDEALQLIEQTWPALKGSLLLRIELINAFAHDSLARALLAVLARSPERHGELKPRLNQCVRALRALKHPWISVPLSLVLAGQIALENRPEQLAVQLQLAVENSIKHGMGMHAAAAQIRLGALLGGEQGAALRATGLTFMHAQRVVAPERMTALLVPTPAGSLRLLPRATSS